MSSPIDKALLFIRFGYDLAVSLFLLLGSRLLPVPHVEEVDLTGKIAVVTGANSGIGLSLATSLARQNATVFLACRSEKRGEDAARSIIDTLGHGHQQTKRVHVVQLDTSDLSSVRAFARSWKTRSDKIDILIHNAGISGSPPGQSITKDGLGLIYATNFLGSFLLTSLIESSLSRDARVIFTSSFGQYGGHPFDLFSNPGYLPQSTRSNKKAADSGFYAGTKCMQVIFAKLLQRRWTSLGQDMRTAQAFTPGYTYTPIFNKMNALPPTFDPVFWFLTTATLLSTPVDVGAATGLWLATTQDPSVILPQNGGGYWDRCRRVLSKADILEATHTSHEFDTLWRIWCKDCDAKWE